MSRNSLKRCGICRESLLSITQLKSQKHPKKQPQHLYLIPDHTIHYCFYKQLLFDVFRQL